MSIRTAARICRIHRRLRPERGQVGAPTEALHRDARGRGGPPAGITRRGAIPQGGDEPGHECVTGSGRIHHLNVGELEQLTAATPGQEITDFGNRDRGQFRATGEVPSCRGV